MTLHLVAKEVAQTNIDKFNELGAFNGEDTCEYHYEQRPFHCAIGVCDPKEELLGAQEPIDILIETESVTTDDPDLLKFIQTLHDYRTGEHYDFVYWCSEYNNICIPPIVYELVSPIKNSGDVTPELYIEVMRRLAQ